MRILRQLVVLLKDYCEHSSMAGVGYIANNRLHISERLFWLICVTLSIVGSYYLINQFQQEFDSKAVSIALDFVRPSAKIYFPTIAICPWRKTLTDERLEDYIKGIQKRCNEEYNYEVELYLSVLMYPERYHFASFTSKCTTLTGCTQCPDKDYRILLEFYYDCEEFFKNCTWYGENMNCCKYFLPLVTPLGKCYMLNSLHNNKPGSNNWFNSEIDTSRGNDVFFVQTTIGLTVHILDVEGIPNRSLQTLSEKVLGEYRQLLIYKEDITNDVDIRELSPKARNCRFPDEVLPNSIYKHYSFSSCILDCLRQRQLSLCNCTLYLLVVHPDDKTPICRHAGNICLDKHDLVMPTVPLKDCECLSSCNEANIRMVSTEVILENERKKVHKLNIRVVDNPPINHRRQAVRTRLDVVVTIGGILGLIMGVSVLSAIEMLYFFTVRICNNKRLGIKSGTD